MFTRPPYLRRYSDRTSSDSTPCDWRAHDQQDGLHRHPFAGQRAIAPQKNAHPALHDLMLHHRYAPYD
jgi:hypothetical protein